MSHPCPYDAMNSVFFAVLPPKKSMKTDQFLSVFSNQKYTVQSPPKIFFDQNAVVVFTEDICGVNISLTGACAIGFPR